MASKAKKEYEVGFGKPPKAKRFRKGRSGNPSGRAKEPRNVTKLLVQALSENVIVNENGQRKQITKAEAMFKQLVNKGAAGDARAIQLLLAELRARVDADPVQDGDAEDSQEQLLMLERLTVAERIELRRLIAKAQGTPDGVAADGTSGDSLGSDQIITAQTSHSESGSDEADVSSLPTVNEKANEKGE